MDYGMHGFWLASPKAQHTYEDPVCIQSFDVSTSTTVQGRYLPFYSRQTVVLQNRVPSGQTWAVAEAISSTLSLVVSACVLNQSRGSWLLSDALASTISMSVKFEMERIDLECHLRVAIRLDIFDSKLLMLIARMREQVVRVLAPFLSFMRVYDPSFAHNMLALMLILAIKSLLLWAGTWAVRRPPALHKNMMKGSFCPF